MDCRLSENHKSCRLNNQVQINFNVEKPWHVVQEFAIQIARNKGSLGGVAPLLYHYVTPNTITNPEKHNNYSTNRFKDRKPRFFRNVGSVLRTLIKRHSQVAGLKNHICTFLHCLSPPENRCTGIIEYCFSSLGTCCHTHFPSRLRHMVHSRYFLPNICIDTTAIILYRWYCPIRSPRLHHG